MATKRIGRQPTGRGTAWQRRRQLWVDYFARGGATQCWKCGVVINQATAWVLGHKTPIAYGGSDDDCLPECRKCSDHEGGTIGHSQAQANRARRRQGIQWWNPGASA